MKANPLVSVIIPSYNHAQYISQAIESVLNQTYSNIELIIVDDGSTDDSHKVLNQYQHHPMIIIILNKKNQGQSAVLNQAFAISSGSYIQLLPSDDWFLPEKTSLQVAKMENCDKEVGVVYAAGERYFEETNKTQTINLPIHTGWIAHKLIESGNFIYPVTPLFRREVFEKVKFSEQFIAEGEAIHMRISLYYRYEYINKVVGVMRDHSYNIGKDAEKLNDEIEKHAEWYFSLSELPKDIRELKKKYLLRNYRIKAMQLILDVGNSKKGRKNIFKYLQIHPLKIFIQPKLIGALIVSFLPHNWTVLLKSLTYQKLKERKYK